MFAKVKAVSFVGLEVKEIEVQVHITRGMPMFSIVGLANKSVSEAKERVRSAIASSGFQFPQSRITINLAPADTVKDGSHYDLPIAVGILTSMGIINQQDIDNRIIIGELSLDGNLNKIGGLLPTALFAQQKKYGIVCPFDCANEGMFVSSDIEITPAKSLSNLISILQKYEDKIMPEPLQIQNENISFGDFSDVKGQEHAKRALEIAASGGHHVLMKGMPGSGKSMLAQRMITIMPDLTIDDMLEVGTVNSISNSLKDFTLSTQTPFRSPHHSASTPSIVGGGKKAKPGEITLAHKGILFLDEFAEYPSNVLESLRQPIETKYITISRAESHITYPADFQLIAAMNPCKCGYLGDVKRECSKAPLCAEDYTRKISGPIMERIDIHIIINPITANIFEKETKTIETSDQIKQRVIKARNIQHKRLGKVNSNMIGSDIENFCTLTLECEKIIQKAMEKFGLSIRQYHKILKVSRTIADLAQCEDIQKAHLMEALSYR